MWKKLLISGLVVMVILSTILLWPFSRYDLARVHESIRSLQKPYRSVTAHYYLDGGSVGLDIIDGNGQQLQLAMPVYDGPDDARGYHHLFLGATYASSTGAVEVVFTHDTKRCLAEIVEGYATAGPNREAALIALRGSPRDYAEVCTRVLLRTITGKY